MILKRQIGTNAAPCMVKSSRTCTHSRVLQQLSLASIHFPAAGWSATHAGVLVTLATNPIWVVKTRMQLENTNVSSAAARAAVAHTTRPTSLTFPGAVKSIYTREGMVGFYRGIGPSLLLCSHGAIQILAYEELKALWKQTTEANNSLRYIVPTHSEPLITGAAAKLVASAFTYPLQVRSCAVAILLRRCSAVTSTSVQASFLCYLVT